MEGNVNEIPLTPSEMLYEIAELLAEYIDDYNKVIKIDIDFMKKPFDISIVISPYIPDILYDSSLSSLLHITKKQELKVHKYVEMIYKKMPWKNMTISVYHGGQWSIGGRY